MATTTLTPPTSFAAASGIVGDAYVASLAVAMTGDGTSRVVEMDGATFEELMMAIEMRAQAFEPRVRVFRPHSVKAITVVQRLDRLWSSIDSMGRDNPRLVPAAEGLREIAEMSDTVSWALA